VKLIYYTCLTPTKKSFARGSIDRKIVITGSFNFTKAAEYKNAENLLIIQSSELAKVYTENWKHHREHSEPYDPRDQYNRNGSAYWNMSQ